MTASRLNDKVTFKSPPTQKDARGQVTGSYTSEKTVRADVEQLSGRELEIANKLVSNAKYKVTTRYMPSLAVKETWRITWETEPRWVEDTSNFVTDDDGNFVYDDLGNPVVAGSVGTTKQTGVDLEIGIMKNVGQRNRLWEFTCSEAKSA